MGWYGKHCNKKDKIAELIKGGEKSKCIAHCYRGNNFRGILWQVWENASGRFITCDVLEYHSSMWWNKPLDESMHPYYYSCPLGYLKITEVVNQDWRDGVKAYHQKQLEKKIEKKMVDKK